MSRPKSKLKKRSAYYAVKGTPGLRLDVRIVKTELEGFYFPIFSQIVERTNEHMSKVNTKIQADEVSFRYIDMNLSGIVL